MIFSWRCFPGCLLCGVAARQADWRWFVNMAAACVLFHARYAPSPALAGGVLSASGLAEAAPTRLALLGTLPRKREREENYTAAVVTPPSTTMVWPVMKLEASEPR